MGRKKERKKWDVCTFKLFILFYYYYSLRVFHWSLSESKSPQVSRTLLSILADLNNATVWMVSTRLLISKSSSPFINPLVTLPRAPFTMGITAIYMFHSFFQFPSKVEVLILLFTFFQFYFVVSRDSKAQNFASYLFFFVNYYKVWRLGDPSVYQTSRGVCMSFSMTDSGLCL